jgi:hypothetical protein
VKTDLSYFYLYCAKIQINQQTSCQINYFYLQGGFPLPPFLQEKSCIFSQPPNPPFPKEGFEPLPKSLIPYFLWRKERSKETSTPSKASPYMGRMQLKIAEAADFQGFGMVLASLR